MKSAITGFLFCAAKASSTSCESNGSTPLLGGVVHQRQGTFRLEACLDKSNDSARGYGFVQQPIEAFPWLFLDILSTASSTLNRDIIGRDRYVRRAT